MRVAVLLFSCAASVHAHGSLVFPPARNNYQNQNPAEIVHPWTEGRRLGGPCAGSACLWFNEGCFSGCTTCIEGFPDLPANFSPGAQKNYYGVPNCANPTEPTLPEEHRTWNIGNQSPFGDYTRYHPWRSPGHAPTSDPCGVAGGYAKPTGGGGETPMGAQQGALGSALPKHADVTTQWRAGGVAEVGWMLAANHGGGCAPLHLTFQLPSSACMLPRPATQSPPMWLACRSVLALPLGRGADGGVPRPAAAGVRGQDAHDPLHSWAQGGH